MHARFILLRLNDMRTAKVSRRIAFFAVGISYEQTYHHAEAQTGEA
jgi:hypothetical protein